MKYVTKIIQDNATVYVIDNGSGNVQVIHNKKPEEYGDKKGETTWLSNGVKIYNDLSVSLDHYSGVHLAQIVLAVEQVKFVMEQT